MNNESVQDDFIQLEIYSAIVDSEYLDQVQEYEEGKVKYGETFGEKNKPAPVKGSYAKKTINASAYKLDSWVPAWDREENCQILIIQWTNVLGCYSESANVKMGEKDFIQNILPFFNGRVVYPTPQLSIPANTNHT